MKKRQKRRNRNFWKFVLLYDYDLLTGKREMTLKDYERITYLVGSLGYSQYLQILIGKYMDLAQADEETRRKENMKIYLEYPEYYEDEGILEERRKMAGRIFKSTSREEKRIFWKTYKREIKATKKSYCIQMFWSQ